MIARCIEAFKLLSAPLTGFRVIDLGSGVGKPSWHFAARGAVLSMGIELVATRTHHCYKAYKEIIEECAELLKTSVSFKVAFGCIDVLQISSLAFFDVVYMFDCGFTPDLLGHIARITGKGRNRWLVSYHDHRKLTACGFNLCLLSKLNGLRFSGSTSSRTAYFYEFIRTTERKRARVQEPRLDDALTSFLDQVNAHYDERLKLLDAYISKFLSTV